ncbi:hypothetical protein QYF36_015729 [Acer negundo]|nr:hypothetical protein QYF36_015729 [Acer negundo]
MMDTSVLRLVPRSVILSSQERGKMAVIQYEKACTNSYLNLISIRLQGHNTFPTTEEKIARYFDSIKKVPSSSALSSSSGSSKRKRRSDDEKTPIRLGASIDPYQISPQRSRSPAPSEEDSVSSLRSQSEWSEASASSFPSQRGLVFLPAMTMTTTDSSPVPSVVQTAEKQLEEIRAPELAALEALIAASTPSTSAPPAFQPYVPAAQTTAPPPAQSSPSTSTQFVTKVGKAFHSKSAESGHPNTLNHPSPNQHTHRSKTTDAFHSRS